MTIRWNICTNHWALPRLSRVFELSFTLAAAVLLFMSGFFSGQQSQAPSEDPFRALPVLMSPPPASVECWPVNSAISTEYGLIYIGEAALCGTNMNWTATYGPDFETHLVDALNEASRWRDCALDAICPAGVIRP